MKVSDKKRSLPGWLGDDEYDKKPLDERVGIVIGIIMVIWVFAMALILGSIKIIEWVL